ncbi:MAG: response regulator [Pseudomonadota bacterium]
MEKYKPKILVVDDEPRNVRLLEAHLSLQNYEILAAYSGKDAMRMASEDKPDLILLDIMMPDIDGFEVTRRLRLDEKTRLMPIVLITALNETKDRIKGIEAGCDDFISKPFDSNEVLARVKTLLKLSYYRSQLDEKEKFEYILDNITNCLVVFNADLRATRFNKNAKILLDIKENEDMSNCIDRLHKNFRIIYDETLMKDICSKDISFDLQRTETDNIKPLILSARTSLVRNPLGEISSIVMILDDVTEQRTKENLKQNFLSLISHKLRSPLAVIRMLFSNLFEGIHDKLNDEQKKMATKLEVKFFNLGELIGNLIGYTAICRTSIKLSGESIEIKNNIEETVEPWLKSANETKVEFNIECPEKLKVAINKSHFDLIIKNLIGNAIKFNDKDIARINIAVNETPGFMNISISDNGPGIPPEEQTKVFEKFYQVEKYFTGNVEGVGLGLPLVKELISAYNGEVSLESELGKGTTITLKIPS